MSTSEACSVRVWQPLTPKHSHAFPMPCASDKIKELSAQVTTLTTQLNVLREEKERLARQLAASLKREIELEKELKKQQENTPQVATVVRVVRMLTNARP